MSKLNEQYNVFKLDGKVGNDAIGLSQQDKLSNPEGKVGNEVRWLTQQYNIIKLGGRGGNPVRLFVLQFNLVKLVKPSIPVKSEILVLLTSKEVKFEALVVK